MHNLLFKIISPDTGITARWGKALCKEGWPVAVCSDYTAIAPACAGSPELHLIEIGLPCLRNAQDLKEVLTERAPISAIVFADQAKASNAQISALLEAGADDFVYKNLDERVLVAKIKAHLRRIMPAILTARSQYASSCGEIQVDCSRKAVRLGSRPGKFTELSNLTQKELDILSFLLAHEKQVVSRESMLEKLWGEDSVNVYCECVDKHIESLRRKLGLYGKRIKTIYGSGYMFMGRE